MNQSVQLFPLALTEEDYAYMYRQVYEQLGKDFNPFVSCDPIPGKLDAEWLYSQVKKLLETVIQGNSSELGAVMYRVDIPEKQVKLAMQTTSPDKKLDELAWLVLRREAQKVWIRKNFSL